MTRNRFILLLEKQLVEQFPGWKEGEKDLTLDDIHAILKRMHVIGAEVGAQIVGGQIHSREVKA